MDKVEVVENPLMATLRARIPGETFRLPSHGVFYTNGELSEDVKNGEVHVFPLTAIDEIVLKTPDKLLSGRAIDEVFARCIPQIRDPKLLLSKDIDYLLMCLRLISYGETVDITYKHTCEDAKPQTYEVALRPLIAKTKLIDPTAITTRYSVVLPSDQTVVMRPPLYSSVMQLYISNFEMSKLSADEQFVESQNQMLDIVTGTIVSVDSVTDRGHIREWIRSIPAGYMMILGDAIQSVSDWGPSTEFTTTCKDCGEEITIDIPLNPVAFFS